MNIFILDNDPVKAAKDHCNKHVVKMVLESAQLLSTAWPAEVAPYKHTHYRHPCALWVRNSLSNYNWLCQHSLALCSEYTLRYKKVHKTQSVAEWLSKNVPNLPDIGLTPFAIAIKDKSLHTGDVVSSYREYYIKEKARFARWEPLAESPAWWPKAAESA